YPLTDMSEITLTDEPITTYYKSKDEEEETNDLYEELMEASDKENLKELKKRIEKMKEDHPDNPVFHNLLGVCFDKLGDKEAATEVINNMVEQFPEYFLGKINKFQWLLQEGHIEEASSIINHDFRLPESLGKEVPIKIFIAFHIALMQYFLQTENLNMALITQGLLMEHMEFEGSENDEFNVVNLL